MEDIFYFIGLIYIIYELFSLLNISKNVESIYRLLELTKLNEDKDFSDYSEEYKNLIYNKGCVPLFFIFWYFMGLMTFNWVPFSIFILFQILLMQPATKLTRYTPMYVMIYFFNTLVSLIFATFVLINHYHIRYDFQPHVINLYNNLF